MKSNYQKQQEAFIASCESNLEGWEYTLNFHIEQVRITKNTIKELKSMIKHAKAVVKEESK